MRFREKQVVIRGTVSRLPVESIFAMDPVLKHLAQEKRFAKMQLWQWLKKFLVLMDVCICDLQMAEDGRSMTRPCSRMIPP
eukprot:g26907.t1